MKTMMIVEIDAGADFEQMPVELQGAIRRCGIEWPQAMVVGTQAVDGKQLILINSSVDAGTLLEWMNGDYPIVGGKLGTEPVYIQFNLGWSVLACEGETIDPGPILPYMLPDVTTDDEGNVIDSQPVTDLAGRLQTWAGRKWAY